MRNRSFLILASFAIVACSDTTQPAAESTAGPAALLSEIDVQGAALDASDATEAAPSAPNMSVVLADGTDAPDLTCVGTFTGGVFDNVTVPPGGQCILIAVTVLGNVKALQDALLSLRSSNVHGNVIGDQADVMQIRNNVIGGNIEIAKGGPHPVFLEVALCGNLLPNGNMKVEEMRGGIGISPFAFCVPPSRNVLVKGNLELEKNILDVPGRRLFVSQNSVGQNLIANKNMGPFEKIITFNNAGEAVQCFDNEPPVVGGPNFAPKREGQCF
jgi:hypothetical protein